MSDASSARSRRKRQAVDGRPGQLPPSTGTVDQAPRHGRRHPCVHPEQRGEPQDEELTSNAPARRRHARRSGAGRSGDVALLLGGGWPMGDRRHDPEARRRALDHTRTGNVFDAAESMGGVAVISRRFGVSPTPARTLGEKCGAPTLQVNADSDRVALGCHGVPYSPPGPRTHQWRARSVFRPRITPPPPTPNRSRSAREASPGSVVDDQ